MPGDEWRRFANLRALYGWMWALPRRPAAVHGRRDRRSGESGARRRASTGLALEGERHRGVQELVRALNRVVGDVAGALRSWTACPAGSSGWTRTTPTTRCTAFLRWSADGREVVACIANLTPVPREGYRGRAAVGGRVAGAARHATPPTSAARARAVRGRCAGRRRRAAPGPARLGVPHRPAARQYLARLPPRDDVPSGRVAVAASLALGRRRRSGRRLLRCAGGGQRADRPQAMAMSLLVFTGAPQFAAVGVLAPAAAVRRGRGQRPAPGRPQRRLRLGAGPDPAGDRWAAGCWRRSSSSTETTAMATGAARPDEPGPGL